MDADGSNQINLTANSGDNRRPSWSQVDRFIAAIAFDASKNGKRRIFRMNADGSDQTSIGGYTTGYAPSWSPNGDELAFASIRDQAWEIYYMNSASYSQPLTGNDVDWSIIPKHDRNPDWGPATP